MITASDRHAALESKREKLRKDNQTILSQFRLDYVCDSDGKLKDGLASKAYYDGSKFQGCLGSGKREEKGIYEYPNGDMFVGDWKNDKFHGQGIDTLT